MMFECSAVGGLDYFPCRYGSSKLLFRGPRRGLETPYVAAIGGSETYGKYVAEPWPALLEQGLSVPVVNLGCQHAGAGLLLTDPGIRRVAEGARLTVVQLVGAANMSSRYYDVHPRRNDRLIGVSAELRSLCPALDFAEFSFVRHLLGALAEQAPKVFALLRQELQALWVDRMQDLVLSIPGPVSLLWLEDWRLAPARPCESLGREPLFVTPAMVAELAPMAAQLIRLHPSDAARREGPEETSFTPMEAPAALSLPGPGVHREVAQALAAAIGPVL